MEVGLLLTCYIPDSNPFERLVAEQRLMSRQLFPELKRTLAYAVLLRSVHYCYFSQIKKHLYVVTFVFGFDKFFQLTPKDADIDTHEKRSDVYLADPCVLRVVFAHLFDVTFKCLNCRLRATAFSAIMAHVALVLETPLEQWLQTYANPMLNDSVSEICSKNFAQSRPCHDKAHTGFRDVFMQNINLINQQPQVELPICCAVFVAVVA